MFTWHYLDESGAELGTSHAFPDQVSAEAMTQVRRFPRGAHHLVMFFVPDQNNGIAVANVFVHFQVDFRHQRTGGVDHMDFALAGFFADGR